MGNEEAEKEKENDIRIACNVDMNQKEKKKKKKKNLFARYMTWDVRLGIFALLCSASIYLMKYVVLGDMRATFSYLFHAFGFLFINVLLVTLVLNKMIAARAKKEKEKKMNILIGIFFSEIGTEILTFLAQMDPRRNEDKGVLEGMNQSSFKKDEDYDKALHNLENYSFEICPRKTSTDEENENDQNENGFENLCQALGSKRKLFILLLQNPMLLEHSTFGNLLLAVHHLCEEMNSRTNFLECPQCDIEHLIGDCRRVYQLLTLSWISYMKYLRKDYPYLFSLAMRRNPFDFNSSIMIISS